jgi:hypothetical protein
MFTDLLALVCLSLLLPLTLCFALPLTHALLSSFCLLSYSDDIYVSIPLFRSASRVVPRLGDGSSLLSACQPVSSVSTSVGAVAWLLFVGFFLSLTADMPTTVSSQGKKSKESGEVALVFPLGPASDCFSVYVYARVRVSSFSVQAATGIVPEERGGIGTAGHVRNTTNSIGSGRVMYSLPSRQRHSHPSLHRLLCSLIPSALILTSLQSFVPPLLY